MSKVYTFPISRQAVDAFFCESVSRSEDQYEITQIKDPSICLFILFQSFTVFDFLKFRGKLTKIQVQRSYRVIDRLDALLPNESAENITEMKKHLLTLLEVNEPKRFIAENFKELLPKLREDARVWADQGFAEFMTTAFEFKIILNLDELEELKIELAKVAHEDPQADYELALRIKRETDLEIDKDIYFRTEHKGSNNPSGLLLGFIGANTFKAFEPLSPTEGKLVQRVFQRRFPKSGLLQETDTESLGKHFESNARAINALKSKIEKKVRPHLAKDLFVLDPQNNITFPHIYTCMHESLRQKQHMRQQF